MGRCIPCEKLQQLYKPYSNQSGTKEVVVSAGTPNVQVSRLEDANKIDYRVSVVDVIDLAIESFIATPALTLKGLTVSTVNFTWAYNKLVESQSIAASGLTIPSLNASDRALALTGQTIVDDKTFTLSGTDGVTTPTKQDSVLFGNHIYVGKGIAYDANTLEATLVAFIQGLADKRLQRTRTGTVNLDTGIDEYAYYASPVSFGVPLFKSRTAVTFGGYFLVATYDIENSAGFTESYYIYRSVYDNLNGQIFDIT